MTPILIACHSRLHCNLCHRASATVEMSLECQASDLLHGFKDFCKSAVKTLLELSSKAPQALASGVCDVTPCVTFELWLLLVFVMRHFISFHHFTSIVCSPPASVRHYRKTIKHSSWCAKKELIWRFSRNDSGRMIQDLVSWSALFRGEEQYSEPEIVYYGGEAFCILWVTKLFTLKALDNLVARKG